MVKRFFILTLFAAMMAANLSAQEAQNKMSFVVGGPESNYNRVRVINHSSYSDFQCRVVFLNEDGSFKEAYGTYFLHGYDDADSNSITVYQGTHLGVQMAKDFEGEVAFDVEYKDYPFYDVIIIYVKDRPSSFDDNF